MQDTKIITVTSGFYDPVGIQHLALFKAAKDFGHYHITGVNSDKCALLKKKQPAFMPLKERIEICKNFKTIDEVREFEDSDGTACNLLRDIYEIYKTDIENGKVKIYFMNGGDRNGSNVTPEEKYVKEKLNNSIQMVYGVGGFNKISSSSDHLRNWVNNTCKRYNVNFELKNKY